MHTPARWPDIAIPTLTLDEAYRVLEHDGTSDSVEVDAIREEIIQDIKKRRGKLELVLLERTQREILDGGTAHTLYESMQEYMTPSGIRITAATDVGVNRHPGSPQKPNEDRIVIDTGVDFVAVIDGVGGHADGDKAAHILAESMQRTRGSFPDSITVMQERMILEDVDLKAGACFMSAQIIWDPNGNPFLDPRQAGDVRLLILNADNTLAVDASGLPLESMDEGLVNLLVANGQLTEDEGHFNRHRSVILHMINRLMSGLTIPYGNLPLYSGQKILLMSDGITDNILTEEMLPLIQGKNASEIIQVCSEVTQRRMDQCDEIVAKSLNRPTAGRYSDGFKTKPKKDNRAIVILEIP